MAKSQQWKTISSWICKPLVLLPGLFRRRLKWNLFTIDTLLQHLTLFYPLVDHNRRSFDLRPLTSDAKKDFGRRFCGKVSLSNLKQTNRCRSV
jgi:hypothetical protein